MLFCGRPLPDPALVDDHGDDASIQAREIAEQGGADDIPRGLAVQLNGGACRTGNVATAQDLLVSQRNDRIDVSGAPRRPIAGQNGNRHEE